MSTARQRQEQQALKDTSDMLLCVGTRIVNDTVTHHDSFDLIKAFRQMASSLEYVTRVDTIKNVCKKPTEGDNNANM